MTASSKAPVPRDPFDRIPDPDAGYAGTVLETPQERHQRLAASTTDDDVTFPADSAPSVPLDDWNW